MPLSEMLRKDIRFPAANSMGKLRLSLAGASLVSLLVIIPVFQILDANPFFHFQYGFDQSTLALIVFCFGIGPMAGYLLFVKLTLGHPRAELYIQIILGLSVLLFISHLYSITLFEESALIQIGVLLTIIVVGALAIIKAPMEIIWGLAWLSIFIIPTAIYQGHKQYLSIPNLRMEKEYIADAKGKPLHNIYIFFLDGSIITSNYLDDDRYPKENILPNLRKFLKEDAQWFPNSLSNSPQTYLSFPSMMTGKLHISSANNYLAHEKNILSILNSRYKMNVLMYSQTAFCNEYPESCFLDSHNPRSMKILFEMYAFISAFRLYPISFKIGELNNNLRGLYELAQRRIKSVNALLSGIKNNTGSNNFYLLQLLDRSERQIKNFDKLMGDFLAALKEVGQYEDSVIVVMSDHGFNFEGDPKYGVTAEQTWPLYKVPFAIKTLGSGEGKLYDYEAQSIDIAPTLLARILPEKEYNLLSFDGVDVLRNRPPRKHYFNLNKKEVMYQLVDREGEEDPELIEVPLSQVEY